MALQDYARLGAFVDDDAVTQVTSISITTNSGQQRVDALNEGLAGFTPGSGDVEVELGFLVPIGGLEDEYQQKCARGDYVKLQIPIGSVSYIGMGKIMNVRISQSTNASVEGSFSWTGELKPLE